MLCRVLLAAIAISYLVCVLFLSGIQKEDLQVSLLKKMQHYNIDFDKNNEELRKECLNNSNSRQSYTDTKHNTTEQEDVTTTEIPATDTITATLDTSELKSVLKYLKYKKKIRNPPTTEFLTTELPENTGKLTSIFDKLMYDKEGIIKRDHDSNSKNHKKESIKTSLLKDMNENVRTYMANIDIFKTTDNKTLIEPDHQGQKPLRGTITNSTDVKYFSDIENISKSLAEYLSQNNIHPTSTPLEPNEGVTDLSQINSHYIEQKFASSIAAINKLNENLAILQNHINLVKSFNSNPTQSVDSKKVEDIKNNYAKGVVVLERGSIQNLAKPVERHVSRIIQDGNTQDAPKITLTEDNYDNNKVVEYVNDEDKTHTNRDELKKNNFAVGSDPEVNNSVNIVMSDYDKQKYINLYTQNNAKNSQPQHNQHFIDLNEPNYNYDDRKLPTHWDEKTNAAAQSSKYSQTEFSQHAHNLKEITNYSYEKQSLLDNTKSPKNQKNEYNDQIPYIPQLQNSQDLTNGYYNQRPENLIPHNQYNTNALGNSLLQGEHPDTYYYNTDKIVSDELNAPVDQNHDDPLKNRQIQYPRPNQMVPESINTGYGKQKEAEAHVVDIQSILDVLKNKKLLQQAQIQEPQTEFVSGYYKQKGLDSHKQNLQGSLTDNYSITNKTEDSRDLEKDQTSLSFDMINKIAESVKEIVLKDLKKEIISSTTSSTYTTAVPLTTITLPTTVSTITITAFTTTSPTSMQFSTTSTPNLITSTPTVKTSSPTFGTVKQTLKASMPTPVTSPKLTTTTIPLSTISSMTTFTDTTTADLKNKSIKIDDNKVQVATQAIEKFIQLFEEMKSAQEQTIKDNQKKSKLAGTLSSKPKYNIPIVMFPPPPPPPLTPINPYAIKGPPKPIPLMIQHYIPPTFPHPPFPPSYITTVDTTNSMAPIRRPQKFEQPHYPDAVMIQTNTHEIQPLGVPMTKPEAMNLNIIVTTQNPFWTREDADRWNYMFKFGRSPNKKNDIKNTKDRLNAYSNAQAEKFARVDVNTYDKKVMYNNLARFKNNKTNDNKMRMNIFKQFDLYNKPENFDKINKEIEDINGRTANNVILQGSRYNELEASHYLTNNIQQINKNTVGHKLNQDKSFNELNFEAYLNQIAKNNDQILYNNRIEPNHDSSINSNINYGQLYNRGIVNPNGQSYLNRVSDDARLQGVQNNYNKDSSQFITKAMNTDGLNQINNFNTVPEQFKLIPSTYQNNEKNRLSDAYGNQFIKENLAIHLHDINAMPYKNINYSNQLKSYRNDHINNFNSMPNDRIKYSDYSRPTLENRYHDFQNPNKYNIPLSYKNSPDEFKASFKNLENYFDNPSEMEYIKAFESKKDKHYVGPIFKNPAAVGNDYSSINKIKTILENKKYHSSSNEENSFREFKTRDRPYHGTSTNSRLKNLIKSKNEQRENGYHRIENKKQETDNNNEPPIDLISAVFGHRDPLKSEARVHEFDSDGNYRDREKYMDNSDVDLKFRVPPVESSDSDFKANNVRGFHEKLESSDWPSDCGPDDRCISSVKILSRQQIPLDSKKPAKYDDTHFKNFLKTQQKVNRMLELILATKTDDFRSVETI